MMHMFKITFNISTTSNLTPYNRITGISELFYSTLTRRNVIIINTITYYINISITWYIIVEVVVQKTDVRLAYKN